MGEIGDVAFALNSGRQTSTVPQTMYFYFAYQVQLFLSSFDQV